MNEILASIDELRRVINSHRPFEDERELKNLQDYYRVESTYTSNAIEGYSYTLSETKVLLEEGMTAGGKPLRDALAVTGHAEAYDYMFSLLKKSEINEQDILFMHKLLSGSLENNAQGGEYRNFSVYITGSKYPVSDARNIQSDMTQVFANYEANKAKGLHTVHIAALLHKDIAYVHPFGDGNGRVARLAMNTVLIQNSYLPAMIYPVIKSQYYECLERGRVNGLQFVRFIAQCVLETHKDMNRLLGGPKVESSDAAETEKK